MPIFLFLVHAVTVPTGVKCPRRAEEVKEPIFFRYEETKLRSAVSWWCRRHRTRWEVW